VIKLFPGGELREASAHDREDIPFAPRYAKQRMPIKAHP
jgi:hypothetical protein